MARTMHIHVTDEQYAYLRWARARTGHTMARLVRHAIEHTYGEDVGHVAPDFAAEVLAPRVSDLDRPLLAPPPIDLPLHRGTREASRSEPARDDSQDESPIASSSRRERLRLLARLARERVLGALDAALRRLRTVAERQRRDSAAVRQDVVRSPADRSEATLPGESQSPPAAGDLVSSRTVRAA
jgi:predicted DNA-binding protein